MSKVQLPYGPHASTPYYGRAGIEPYGPYGEALRAARAAGTQPEPLPAGVAQPKPLHAGGSPQAIAAREPGPRLPVVFTLAQFEADLRRLVRYPGA